MVLSMEAALNALLESDIKALPIPYELIQDILRNKGYEFISYSLADLNEKTLFKKLKIDQLAQKTDCFTYNKEGKKIVFYRDGLSAREKAFVFAHELGHLCLEHTPHDVTGMFTSDGQEREANEFAIEFLAPTCVLKETELKTVSDIMTYTSLSYEHAFTAYGKVSEKYLFSMLNNEICSQFSDYIYHCRNNSKQGIIKKIVFAVAVILIFCLIIMAARPYNNLYPRSETTPTPQTSTAIVDE